MFSVMRPHFKTRLTGAWAARLMGLAVLLLGASMAWQPAEAQTHYGIEGSYTINMIMTSNQGSIEDTKQFDITMSGLKFAYTGTANGFDNYKVTAGNWKVVGQYTVLAPCGEDGVPNHLYIDGDFSGQGAYPSAQAKLLLRVPADRAPGAKAKINAVFGPEAITCAAKIYDCEGSESPYSFQTGLKWSNQPGNIASFSSPADTFTVRASAKITRQVGLVTQETWPLLSLYTRYVKAPPVVKPKLDELEYLAPLVPVTVQAGTADPNGIEGEVELAPLVPAPPGYEASASLAQVTTYGRGNFKIGPNKRTGLANVRLNSAAKTILGQSGELACVAVVRAWDKLGNRKSTKTEVTIRQQ